MEHLNKVMENINALMELIDKVSPFIPERDYIQMCDTLKSLRNSSMSHIPPFKYEPSIFSTYVPQAPAYTPIIWEQTN
jgi:hypothetical protein